MLISPMDLLLEILAWVAIGCLSFGYSFQAYKVYQTGQTRGLSFKAFLGLCFGFSIMFIVSLKEATLKFALKQIFALLPTLYITIKIWIQSHKKEKYVLLVDDSTEIHDLFRLFLKMENIRTFHCHTKEEALMYSRERKFDVIFIDLNLNEEDNGIKLMNELLSENESQRCVLISSTSSLAGDDEEFEFLAKPLKKKELLNKINNFQ